MTSITIDQVDVGDGLNISDLTTSKLQGSGVLDIMLETARVHLDDQFKQNRIRGTEYANAYIALFEATLNAATQFTLAKERQALEIKGLELQNQLAQAQIDQIQSEMTKTPYEIAQIKAGTEQTLAQTEDIKVKTEQDQYTLDNLLPLQKAASELANESAQFNLDKLLPLQQASLETDNATKEYNLNTTLPLQTAGLETENATREYNLNTVLPTQVDQTKAQIDSIVKDTSLKDYQLTYLYPAQLESAQKQNELLAAQIANQTKQLELLAEQVSQAKAQTAYYDQKTITEEAQVDPSVIKDGSVIATQLKLMNGQYDGYKRNAEQAVLQVLTNTWNVRRQTDEDTSANSTNLLDDATVGKMIQKALAGVDLSVTPS